MRISHYEIQGELARGGMGVVYRAVDLRSGASVVVKLLQVDHERSRRRLEREAEAMRRLVHPSVVTLYDYGVHEDAPFLVLPYVEGESLQDRLEREGSLPAADVVQIGIHVGEGLQAAHAIGLLHRDVKPANVLVDSRLNDTVKLTDFGLVKDVTPDKSASVGLSIQGRFLGTPGYWPPEQARGRLNAIGPASDVYGLGALLYALLCGRPPRSAASLVEAVASFEQPVAPLGPSVPGWLADLVLRCLEREPTQRPALGVVLKALGSEGELAAPEATAPRGRSTLPAVVALLIAALGGGGALLWATQYQAPEGPAPAEGTVASDEQVEALIKAGNAKLRSGKFAQAIRDYERVLELDPPEATAQPVRELLERARGKLAQRDLTGAARKDEAAAHIRAGDDAHEAGNFRGAVERYGRALEFDPESALAHWRRGTSYLRMVQPERAIKDFDRALDLGVSPNSVEAVGALKREAAQILGERRAKALIMEGNRHHAAGRVAEALACSVKAVKHEPTNVTAIYNVGICNVELGRDAEAIKAFSQILKLKSKHPLAHYQRGGCYNRLGEYRRALYDYDEVTRLGLNTELRLALFELRARVAARLLREQGEELPTPEDLKRAVVTAFHGYGHLRANRHLEAIDAFSRALELDPRYGLAYCGRGIGKTKLKQFAEAIRDHDAAIKFDPDYAGAYHGRAVCLHQLGRYAEALEDYIAAGERDPREVLILAGRARCKLKLGLYAQALAELDTALEVIPPGEIANGLKQKRAEAARKLATWGSKSTAAQTVFEAGLTQHKAGKLAEAVEAYDRAIELDPAFALAYRKRGVCKGQLERNPEAIEDFSAATRLAPSDAAAFRLRGSARGVAGDYAGAVEDCTRAIELDPGVGLAYARRGSALVELDRRAEALVDYEKALELGVPMGLRGPLQDARDKLAERLRKER